MTAHAELLLPPQALASCLALAIYRDTTRADLSDADRLNYFPASPLFTVTRVFAGRLHMASEVQDVATLREVTPLAPLSAAPPQDQPVSSWSPRGLRAVTLAVYPEAWRALGGDAAGTKPPDPIAQALQGPAQDIHAFWAQTCTRLAPEWQRARHPLAAWHGSHRVTDWARHVTTAAALSGTGRSLRSVERRLRRMTGHSRQALDFFVRAEDLHARIVHDTTTPLAQIAADAAFADQSHMGRMVKRATGFSPAHINRRIAEDEPFWCYRLLGERF